MGETATLGWTDYIVIAAMLAISVGIGIYYRLTGGKQKTTEEYFSANRSMSILPVGIGLMVSFMSAITLLGVSAENYVFGTQFVVINISYLIGTPIVCYGYLPVFYKLQATSAYEYLARRFGLETRLLASIVLWIQMLLYSGVVLYAPALALEATTGLSTTASILVVGLACAFYSSIGGIKAVLVTDIFQAFLMFACLIMVIVTAASSVGGLGEIWRIAEKGGRIQFDNYSIDPTERYTWWSLTIGGMCTFLSLYGVNQIQVQRMLTVKSLPAARKTMWINWPILTLLSITVCFSGLAIYSKYENCDPMKQRKGIAQDMLMPLYVMETMSSIPGLAGLFIAGIFAAGLSTISAALNSLSAVTLEDYVKPFAYKVTGNEIEASRSIVWSKIMAFILGIICIGIAFLAQYLGGVLQTSLTIFGVVGGPLLGLFTFGMLFESATQRGALSGAIVALTFLLWIAFRGPRPKPQGLPTSVAGCNSTTVLNNNIDEKRGDDSEFFYLYRISYLWYAPLGLLITVLLGWLVSNVSRYFFPEKDMHVNPDLFFPFVANRIRKREADFSGICGIEFKNQDSFPNEKKKSDEILEDINISTAI